MKKFFLVSCFLTVCSATFLPFFKLGSSSQSMTNVCIYSVDPAQYAPKCFICPSDSYSTVLQTCVNGNKIPRNVSYTEAKCLEQNCAVRRGRRSIPTEGGKDNSFEWSQSKRSPSREVELHQLDPSKDSSFNYDSDKRQSDKDISIVREEETFALPDEDFEKEYGQDEDYRD